MKIAVGIVLKNIEATLAFDDCVIPTYIVSLINNKLNPLEIINLKAEIILGRNKIYATILKQIMKFDYVSLLMLANI